MGKRFARLTPSRSCRAYPAAGRTALWGHAVVVVRHLLQKPADRVRKVGIVVHTEQAPRRVVVVAIVDGNVIR